MTFVNVEIDDHIAVVTIERTEALNALNAEVLHGLLAAVDQLAASAARCAVVTGAGDKAFVAGADIASMSTMSQTEAREFSELGNRAMRAIERLDIPTIAAVNGFALGGGCELALACDMRYASQSASFAQPEVGLGITAGFGGTQRLARAIGVGAAKELLYSGARIDADEALRIGLVNRVVPATELMDAVRALAGRIAGNAPVAVQATKRAVDLGCQTDIDTGLGIEAALFGSCFERDDQRQAMAAFVDKRKPAPFTGS